MRFARSPLALVTVAFFVARAVLSLTRSGPTLVADEIGYLTNARVLAGGTPGQMSMAAFTHGGYSLLLAPIVAVFGSPFTEYRLVLVVNAALAAALVPLLYALVRTVLDVDRRAALASAALAAAFPSVTILSQFAMSENLLYPAFAAWLLAAAKLLVDRSRPVLWSIVLAVLTAVLFAAHGRMIVLIPLALVVLFGALRFRIIDSQAAVTGLVVLGVGLIGEHLLDHYLADRNFSGGTDEVSGRLDALRNAHAASIVARNLFGQTWYLLVASLALPVGAFAVARARRALVRSGGLVVVALLALVTAGLVAVSALTFTEDYRPDQFIYGRYTEIVMPCAIALALALVVPALRTVRIWPVLVVVIISSVVVALLRTTLDTTTAANRVDVAALPAPPFNLQAVALVIAGIAASFWLVCLTSLGRRRESLAWLVVAVAFAAPTLNTLRNPVLTGERNTYGHGWTSPGEAVDQSLPVAYDTSHSDLIGMYAYQWFFDHARYRLVSGRPAAGFRGYLVSAAGRKVGRVVWRDPNRDQAIYALGGAP